MSNPYQAPPNKSDPPATEKSGSSMRILFLVAVVVIGMFFKFVRFQAKQERQDARQREQQQQLEQSLNQMREAVQAGQGGEASRILFGVDGPANHQKDRAPEAVQPTQPVQQE